MRKTTKQVVQNARANPLPFMVQVVGIIVILANLWIASKLSPLAQDLAVLQTEVNAVVEQKDDHLEEYDTHVRNNVETLKAIEVRLDEMHGDILVIKNTVSLIRNGD